MDVLYECIVLVLVRGTAVDSCLEKVVFYGSASVAAEVLQGRRRWRVITRVGLGCDGNEGRQGARWLLAERTCCDLLPDSEMSEGSPVPLLKSHQASS